MKKNQVQKYLNSKEQLNSSDVKEEFNYTKEQYKNRICLGKTIYLYNKTTLFTVWLKSYFSDKTTNRCIVTKESVADIDKKYKWLMTCKIQSIAVIDKNHIKITLMRKSNCTAEEFFDKIDKKVHKQKEVEDEWEGCKDW